MTFDWAFLCLGLVAGGATVGMLAGRDLARFSIATGIEPAWRAAFGVVRRSAMLLGVLFAGRALAPWGWAPAVAAYGGGFVWAVAAAMRRSRPSEVSRGV